MDTNITRYENSTKWLLATHRAGGLYVLKACVS